jgi:hypothetical protein
MDFHEDQDGPKITRRGDRLVAWDFKHCALYRVMNMCCKVAGCNSDSPLLYGLPVLLVRA